MRSKVSQCQCEKLKLQIESFESKLSSLNIKLEDEKKKQFLDDDNTDQEINQLKTKIESIQSDNRSIELKIADLKATIQSEQISSQKKINDLTQKQKSELSLVAERVKQTVAKKDEIIQNLMTRLNEIGNEDDF